MPKDSSGNFTYSTGPFVSGTTILSNVMNQKLQEILEALSTSLDKNGLGGMLARWRGVDGTAALPAYSFTSEITLGWYRAGTADLRAASNATDLLKLTTAENRSYSPLKVSTGGLTVDAGGLTVTSGNLLIDSGTTQLDGALTVTAGGAAVTGTLPAVSGVAGASSFTASGTMSTTNGESHALTTLAKSTSAGPNVLQLNARSKNTAPVTSWDQVDVGLSYDVDGTVGSGGSFYLGKAGAKLTGATTASGPTPANALELTNGNLKLSGTAPDSTVAVANTLTPANMVKAWVLFTTGGSTGVGTILDGYGVSSVTISNITQRATINWATAFSSANYGVSGTIDDSGANSFWVAPVNRLAGSVEISAAITSTSWTNLYTTARTIYIEAVGRQT